MAMASSNLEAIQKKVRRLTRTPSPAQLSTTELNEYINTFVLYNFPEHLKLFDLKSTFTFTCNPNQDTYITDDTLPATDPLYDFKNKYINVLPPLYIAGFPSYYSQSREQFFAIYPFVNSIASIGSTGDGVTTVFTGFLSGTPVLQNNVLFSSVGVNNEGLALVDLPIDTEIGSLVVPGTTVPQGTIEYLTGEYTLNFPTPPGAGQAITSQTVPYVASLPQAMLYFDNKFILRPVPDQPYRIQFEVYKRPTELLDQGQNPDLNQWWEYIAYGSAIKVLQDRMDIDTVNLIMPEYKNQERLVLRKTLGQNSTQRTMTIYTEQTGLSGYNPWWGWWGSQF